MSKELRGDDPRTFMGQIAERISGHAPGYDIAIYARPYQWRYLIEDHERLARALDGMVKCFDPAALEMPPESAVVRSRLEEARNALAANQQQTVEK